MPIVAVKYTVVITILDEQTGRNCWLIVWYFQPEIIWTEIKKK